MVAHIGDNTVKKYGCTGVGSLGDFCHRTSRFFFVAVGDPRRRRRCGGTGQRRFAACNGSFCSARDDPATRIVAAMGCLQSCCKQPARCRIEETDSNAPSFVKQERECELTNVALELEQDEPTAVGVVRNELDLHERYRTMCLLGKGGYSTVFRVVRKSDDSEFAAKSLMTTVFNSHWAKTVQSLERWALCSEPSHPTILPLVEILHIANESPRFETYHLIMPLMNAELDDVLEHVEMSEHVMRTVAVQVASAIGHLHLTHSHAHRDVKPPNVAQHGSTVRTLCGYARLCALLSSCVAYDGATAALPGRHTGDVRLGQARGL